MSAISEPVLTIEDQNKINRFSKYNLRKNQLIQDQQVLEKRVKEYKNAIEELEVIMDDQLDFQIGKCYFLTNTNDCMDSINEQIKQDQSKIKDMNNKKQDYNKILNETKSQLYEKFGNRINLEEQQNQNRTINYFVSELGSS